MLPKIVKKALKNLYKQTPIRHYMESMRVVWHEVSFDEGYTRFAIFTYGDETKDFETFEELQRWARDRYEASRARLPEWDCSGLTFIWLYDVIELPKMDNACAVIFRYAIDC